MKSRPKETVIHKQSLDKILRRENNSWRQINKHDLHFGNPN